MTRRDLTSEVAEDKFDVEAEAKRRGIEPYQLRATQVVPDRLVKDIVADAYRGISTSASMIPDRLRSEPSPKGNGWVDPAPLSPPSGIDHIDRMVEAQSHKEKLAAIKQRIENDWIEHLIEEKSSRAATDYNPISKEWLDK